MANASVRNLVIGCVAAIVLVATVALALHLRTRRQPTFTAAQAAASQGHKPSAYGEAFVPPPTRGGHSTHSDRPVGIGYFAGQPYPSVPPQLMAAKLISAPPPAYPFLARIAHVRGQVAVQAIISTNGTVSAARAVRGHELLRGAAVAEVRRRRYRPYRIDGQPANVSTIVTVDFDNPS